MAGIDAKFLYSETRTAHMHTLKVAVFEMSDLEGSLTYDEIVELFSRRLNRLPPFRRRPIAVPFGLGHPVWIEDPEFQLRRHVKRTRVARPGGDRELAAVIAEIASTPLARNRPLWEIVVVEGLAGDRIAVVAKVHHALADGAATVALLQSALGTHIPDSLASEWRPEELPTRSQLLALAVHGHRDRLRQFPRLLARSVLGIGKSEARRRASQVRPPLPFDTPRTVLNVSLTPERTFAMTTLPLDDLRAIRRVLDVTLNDVYLAVCSGAIRSYLQGQGGLPDRTLVASVPVATAPRDVRLGGNRVDNLYVSIGTDIPDPIERVRHIRRVSAAAKEVRSLLGSDLLERRADIVPPQLYELAIRAWTRTHLANHVRPPVNVVLSNVAGPTERLAVGAATLESLYSVGPILEGIGLNITAWSYAKNLHVSVLGCPASLPDPWPLAEAVQESLTELTRSLGIIPTSSNRTAPVRST